MSINSNKSNVIFISSRQNRQILQSNTEIPYHDSAIKSCSTAKLLGVTVNNSLSWNDHIETVIEQCNTYLYIWSQIKLYFSNENRKRFYNAYILPHFVLCCVIWGNYIYMKAVQMLKLLGEMRLDTLDRLLLLRLIYMQDCYVHRLISSCILQNLI